MRKHSNQQHCSATSFCQVSRSALATSTMNKKNKKQKKFLCIVKQVLTMHVMCSFVCVWVPACLMGPHLPSIQRIRMQANNCMNRNVQTNESTLNPYVDSNPGHTPMSAYGWVWRRMYLLQLPKCHNKSALFRPPSNIQVSFDTIPKN